jgi:hypothetical protein
MPEGCAQGLCVEGRKDAVRERRRKKEKSSVSEEEYILKHKGRCAQIPWRSEREGLICIGEVLGSWRLQSECRSRQN